MYGGLEPLGEPVGDKGDVGNKAHHFAVATSGGSVRTHLTVARGGVLSVDGGESDRKPSCVEGPDESSEETDHVDMTVVVGDVDGSFEHQGAKGDAADPGDESDDHENDEDQKDDAAGVVLSMQHVDGGCQAKEDVQDAGEPNDLLGEKAYQDKVEEAQDHGDGETKEEDVDGIVVEGERVNAAIATLVVHCEVDRPLAPVQYLASKWCVILTVAANGNARHDDVAGHGSQEENAGPDIVPLGLVDFEGLLEGDLFVGVLELLLLLRGRVTSLGRVAPLGRRGISSLRRVLLLHWDVVARRVGMGA